MNAAVYEVAVAKKALASTREQGEQALALIEAATATPAAPRAPEGSVGQLLDVRA